MLRVWAALLCLAFVSAAPVPVPNVPYGVDDLIALESLGQVMIDPGERLVVVERRRPHDQAPDYGYGPFENRALSNILAADIARPEGLKPLFAQEAGAGYWLGGFSPSGRRLSVFRLANRRLDLGIVDMKTRLVRWLDVAPDLPIADPAPSWVGDDALVLVTRRDHRLPLILSIGNGLQSDLATLWTKAAAGAVTSATTATTSAVSGQAGTREVTRIDLLNGRTTVLASGAITDALVSSSGAVAVVSTVAPLVPPADTSIAPDFVSLRHVIDVVSGDGHGEAVRIGDDILPATLAWDDTGRRLAFVSRIAGRDWRQARWQVATSNGSVGIRTMDVAPTIQGEQSSLVAHARWAGDRLLIEGHRHGGPREWFLTDPSGNRASAALGAGELVFADRKAAWLREEGVLTRTSLPRMHRTVVMTGIVAAGTIANDPSSVGVRLLDNPVDRTAAIMCAGKDGRQVTIIDDQGLSSSRIGVAQSARLLAIGHHHVVAFSEDARGVGALSLAADDGSSSELTRLNVTLGDRLLPTVIKVTSRLSDGRDHAHWLFLPKSSDPVRPPPLVVMVYPGMMLDDGPDAGTGPSYFLQPNSVPILVGHGFAVLTPSLPAPGNGLDPLGAMAADVDSAVDAALEKHVVDPARMVVLGHSYGGFAALALGARSTRYRGIIAASGPYDLATAHGAMTGADRIRLEFGLPLGQDAGWAEGGQAAMVVPPWADPARYVAKSPIYAIDHVHAPVLLLHGETDVVSLEQAERAFMELARLGRDATLVRYWGEGHTLASPANIRDYWSRVLSWTDDHLKPEAERPATPLTTGASKMRPQSHQQSLQ